jgi:hypothetical protein
MPLAHLPYDPYSTDKLTNAFDEAWAKLCALGDHLAHDVEEVRIKLAFFVMSRPHLIEETRAHLIDEAVTEFRSKLAVG